MPRAHYAVPLQVQMHRQTDESAEMLALSRCLLSDDAQPEPLGMLPYCGLDAQGLSAS